MRRYKIVTNGKEYRVREWNWYWPFWSEINVMTSPYSFGTIIFESRDEAQEWIDLRNSVDEYQSRKWLDVK